MTKIIEVNGLEKSFGDLRAVKGISFYVEQGKLFAFLGPNGAGKSTTIDMLCTLLAPDSGQVTIDGHSFGADDDKIRGSVGVVFQSGVLDDLLTVRENLMCRGSLYGLEKSRLSKAVMDAARAADALEFLDRPYGKLSGGQKRRADIARALVNTPKVLFLDEPTTGLDPKTKEGVWSTITKLQKDTGMTVFLTTHYMEEAAMADYIIIIDHGEIAAKGTPYQLKEEYSSDLMRVQPKDNQEVSQLLLENCIAFDTAEDSITIKLKNTMEAMPIIELLKEQMLGFEVVHGSMEDVFLNVTGRGKSHD